MAGFFKTGKIFLMSNCAEDVLVLLRLKRTVCVGILVLSTDFPRFDYIKNLIDDSGLSWVSKLVLLIPCRKVVLCHEVRNGFLVVKECVAIGFCRSVIATGGRIVVCHQT